MPLVKDLLKENLLNALNEVKQSGPGSPYHLSAIPLMSPAVANLFAQAYHNYAKAALAGALLPATPGQPAALAGALAATPLMAGWGPGLVAYWTPVIFAGPGFIPANPTIAAAAAGASAELAPLLVPPPQVKSEEEFADKLATILHTYTTKVQVTATTTSVPPVVSTLPLS